MSKEISRINVSGNIYTIKDAEARNKINTLESKVSNSIIDEADSVIKNALNFEEGIKISDAVITCEGDTVTFS